MRKDHYLSQDRQRHWTIAPWWKKSLGTATSENSVAIPEMLKHGYHMTHRVYSKIHSWENRPLHKSCPVNVYSANALGAGWPQSQLAFLAVSLLCSNIPQGGSVGEPATVLRRLSKDCVCGRFSHFQKRLFPDLGMEDKLNKFLRNKHNMEGDCIVSFCFIFIHGTPWPGSFLCTVQRAIHTVSNQHCN